MERGFRPVQLPYEARVEESQEGSKKGKKGKKGKKTFFVSFALLASISIPIAQVVK